MKPQLEGYALPEPSFVIITKTKQNKNQHDNLFITEEEEDIYEGRKLFLSY